MSIGRRFLVGAPDGPPGDVALRLLEETGAANLLLFRRNIPDPSRLPDELARLRERLGRSLAVSIDHEGGQVLRHVHHSTVFPGNRALALVAEKEGLEAACDLARRQGAVMGAELAGLGIGWNLAPALDLVCDWYNPGMTLRSYGSDPASVGVLGAAFVRGVHAGGGAACVKHFPGTGEARVDPHEKLPRIDVDADRLRAVHASPFVPAIDTGVDAVMTSHGFFPQVDSVGPATFSREIVHGWLRRDMGFEGVITTDDLEMGAITTEGDISSAAVAAAAAGHDLLLVGQAAEKGAIAAIDAVRRALDEGTLSETEHRASLDRVDTLVERIDVARLLVSAACPPREGNDPGLAQEIAMAGLRIVRDPAGLLPLSSRQNVRVIVPDVRPVADWICFEDVWLDPAALADRVWPGARVAVAPLGDGDLIGTEKNDPDAVDVVLLYDATENPGQAGVLRAIHPGRSVVVPVRNFWDHEQIPTEASIVDAGGFRLCQLDAVARILKGQ